MVTTSCEEAEKNQVLYLGLGHPEQNQVSTGKEGREHGHCVGNFRVGHQELKNQLVGASLVAQWLRICLPMQGARVRALVWEDPTCRGATRPVSHNY